MAAQSDQFTLSLARFVKKAKDRADAAVRKIVLDVGARIIMRSPVGDGTYWANPPAPGYVGGHFRGNWQYGEGVRPAGVVSRIDPSGGATLGALASQVQQEGAGGRVHFLMNNLPYALRLEHGWSVRQAPRGMVHVTVVEYRTIVRDAIKAIKS